MVALTGGSMSEAPFMQLWVADFVGDTMHLSKAQVGEYLLLLMAMWRNGGTLPNNPKQLARIAKGAVSDAVMAMFDEVADGGITQARLQKELERALKKSQARRASGKLGYQAKVLKNKEAPQANATPLLKHLLEPEPESEKEVREEGASPPAARGPYAYSGKVVRLNPEDHARWKASFSFLDLNSELEARDNWLAEQPDSVRRRWFGSTSKYLANRNMEAKAKAQAPPKPNPTADGFNRAFARIRAHAAATSNQEPTNVVDLSEVRRGGEGVSDPPCDVEPSNGRG
jgi:uncharacterized protein YdaU (DUF1376 family)